MTIGYLLFKPFIGSLHPLLVHLPIGFLVLAFILHIISRNKKEHPFQSTVPVIVLLGALSAIPAIVFGLFLETAGEYNPTTLAWHKYSGILVLIVSLAAWGVRRYLHNAYPNLFTILMTFVFVLVGITGHFGGSLTHGSDYLVRHAPAFIKSIFNYETAAAENHHFANLPPDSIVIFQHLVRPVLEGKCYSCHNADNRKGGLSLLGKESLTKGGDSGPLFVSGKAHSSLLMERITLNRRNPKFMPPKGEPLSYQEMKLIEWWINSRASLDTRISDREIAADIEYLLNNKFNVNTRKLTYIETLSVATISESDLQQIRERGFIVNRLAQNNNLLEVSYSPATGPLTASKLSALMAIKDQVVWLNLQNNHVEDEMVKIVSAFPNLIRLRLDQNPISDTSIEHLSALSHLQVLNLYGTAITDKSIQAMAGMPSLKKVYVWQTAVTMRGVENLKSARPDLDIDTGFSVCRSW